jgi:hypothetical protein
MEGMTPTVLRFRHSSALTVAAVVVMLALVSVLTYAPWLLVLEVIPFAVAVWSWRAGTDVTEHGLTVRALLGQRRIGWREVAGLVTDERGRVSAHLASGRAVPLPAVGKGDLERVVAMAGGDLVSDPR